ncbi:MAG: histidine phosphatase family protein [Betaproteobacteria bacterium]|nr:histidine phosphatase family protein [Betaproteobacteria bacterium]
MTFLRALAALLCMLAGVWSASAQEGSVWPALRDGGLVLMLRHAETDPGIGDPPDFRLGDCSTQRNLSAAGRAQARRFGQRLKQQGVDVDAVYSSRWCRCLDTARLAFGKVTPLPALDSFFGEPQRREAQTADLRRYLAQRKAQDRKGNLVLVTHQVNITALTGIHPAMGEAVVLQHTAGGALEVIGRLPPP